MIWWCLKQSILSYLALTLYVVEHSWSLHNFVFYNFILFFFWCAGEDTIMSANKKIFLFMCVRRRSIHHHLSIIFICRCLIILFHKFIVFTAYFETRAITIIMDYLINIVFRFIRRSYMFCIYSELSIFLIFFILCGTINLSLLIL
jgi:hypothetical protein